MGGYNSLKRWEDIAEGRREGRRLQANYPGPRYYYTLNNTLPGIHTCICVCIHPCVCTCICIHSCVCTCICIHSCVCICICEQGPLCAWRDPHDKPSLPTKCPDQRYLWGPWRTVFQRTFKFILKRSLGVTLFWKSHLNVLLLEITATEYRRSITSFYNNHFTLEDLNEQQVVTWEGSPKVDRN